MGWNDHPEDYEYIEIDKAVCSQCVGDSYLAGLVEANSGSYQCSYCRNESQCLVTEFHIIMKQICIAVDGYYRDAMELDVPIYKEPDLSFELDIYDVMDFIAPSSWCDELVEDVAECLGKDKNWLRHSNGDWGRSDLTTILSMGWDRFKKQVLHRTRFFFSQELETDSGIYDPDEIPMNNMLDAVSNTVDKLDLIELFPAGATLYRVRAKPNSSEAFTDFKELSVPPKEYASSGRMNPAGIPYLYVARDLKTARLETLNSKDISHGVLQITNKQELRLLNLSKIPELPSLLDTEKRNKRDQLLFIMDFIADISAPIKKDGQEHLEYVPTQILSEYFRYVYRSEGMPIDGIMYKSSKSENGINIALFLSDHTAVEKGFDVQSIQNYCSFEN